MIELPDGVTLNKSNDNKIIIDFTEEKINDTKCMDCEFHLQAILVTNSFRHNGLIKSLKSNTIIWENILPKDRTRSITMLNENLSKKLAKHRERHKND
jgi:hypothetical protein